MLTDLIKSDVQFSDAQLRGRGRQDMRPPLPFLENQKICLNFGKKALIVWVKLNIENVVLRVSKRKKSEIYSCVAFCSWFFDEMFMEEP